MPLIIIIRFDDNNSCLSKKRLYTDFWGIEEEVVDGFLFNFRFLFIKLLKNHKNMIYSQIKFYIIFSQRFFHMVNVNKIT